MGHELVRLDQDARRARQQHPAQARGRRQRAAISPHHPWGRLQVRGERRGRMSLRLRLLVAFAYVSLLILVALEVPLALNLSRRINAEVRDDAASQAFVVAAGASGRMNSPKELRKLVHDAGAQLGARVIVVDARGRLKADSAGA